MVPLPPSLARGSLDGRTLPRWRQRPGAEGNKGPACSSSPGVWIMPLCPRVSPLQLSAEMLQGLSLPLSPSLGYAPAMEIREQTGKLSPTREFPMGSAGPSRWGISPPSSPPLSPKVTCLPQGNPPLYLPTAPSTHPVCRNPSCLGLNPHLGKFLGPAWPSSPRVLMEPHSCIWRQPCTPRLPASPMSWGAQGAKGPFGVRAVRVAFWGVRGFQPPQPEAPIPAMGWVLTPLPLPMEAPASGTGPWLELASPSPISTSVGTAPGQRWALVGPSEPCPRTGQEATQATKRPSVWGSALAAASRSCVQVTEAWSETGLGIVWWKRRS